MEHKRHSEEFFTEARDLWWNADYLDLLKKRLRLSLAKKALDVGCGVGHWASIVASLIPKSATIVGVDIEPEWIKEATERTLKNKERISFTLGNAYSLPFPNESFDLVTCQTLLMHLDNPVTGLKEMVRVLKPNGLLLCAEPENLFSMLNSSSTLDKLNPEQLSHYFEFWARYETGKCLLKQGNNSIARNIPGYFAQLGLRDIRAYLADKTIPIFTPYTEKQQLVMIEQMQIWVRNRSGIWDMETLKRNYIASGGKADNFMSDYEGALVIQKQMLGDIDKNEFSSAGGGLFYVFSARK